MLLSVWELEQGEVAFDETFAPGQTDLSGTNFRQIKQLRIIGRATLLPGTGEIRVRGRVSGQLEAKCDRCLETVPYVLDREFDLFYRSGAMQPEHSDAELDEAEADVGYYAGQGLETADVLREQVLLWLPMQWVCSETCSGICPVCGINRNREKCNCRPEGADDRWEALRNFRPSR